MNFRVMLDACFLYVWCEITDDEVDASGIDALANDGIVIYLDGDNSKNSDPDADDIVLNYVWNSDAPSSPEGRESVAWGSTDSPGYTFEMAIPLSGLLPVPEYISDIEFGFEIQVTDRDHQVRESIMGWWSDDGAVSGNPGLYGTCEFILLPGAGTS